MLFVYDLACEHLRDPRDVPARPLLSWRLGSTDLCATQRSARVVVTNARSGVVAWDSGDVSLAESELRYAGLDLDVGETYVWFVKVTATNGDEASAPPATFVCGNGKGRPSCDMGPQRVGMLWTSDERLNEELEICSQELVPSDVAWPLVWDAGYVPTRARSATLVEELWYDALGVRFWLANGSRISVNPRLWAGLTFARGSLLTPRGLLVVEATAGAMSLQLPPGTELASV